MKNEWKTLMIPILIDKRGVTIILVALLMFVFLGIAALAIDLSHLYVVRNELHNAADAGALAGARFLYNENGTLINSAGYTDSEGNTILSANKIAYDAATANKALASNAGAIEVDINWADGQNTGDNIDIQRGHWRFSDSTFTANDSTAPVDLWGVSDEDLDKNLDFINAVRVVARRQGTPASSFFARIFGFEDFELSKEAVAYIGFAGILAPGEVDLPIAICSQAVTGDLSATECTSGYDCNIGRMLTDGDVNNSAAWTNFSQPCDTANTDDMRDLLTCSNSNPYQIKLGDPIGATNGVIDAIIGHPTKQNLVDCWKSATYELSPENDIDNPAPIDGDDVDDFPERPWNVTLPVVNCPETQVGNCMETCGSVNLNIVWILEKDSTAGDINNDAPRRMWNPIGNEESDGKPYMWTNDNEDGGVRWNDFVQKFNLQDPHGDYPLYDADNQNTDGYKKKTIYFLPDCAAHELSGTTGGHNYGVLARIPVLVK